jgi:hypothetical protein
MATKQATGMDAGELFERGHKLIKARSQKLVQLLAPLRVHTSQVQMFSCVFCKKPIKAGEQYRNGGYGCRAHEECFQMVSGILAAELLK